MPADRRDTRANVRSLPLTNLQKSMVLASMRAPRAGIYVIQDVCELSEEIDTAVLRNAWERIAARHAALRTGIDSATFVQTYQDSLETFWQELDWSACSPEARETKWLDWLRADRERGFALDGGVPLRFTFIRKAPQANLLVWTVHHALIDGRSLHMVWREWWALYDALRRGDNAKLESAEPFHRYVEWSLRQDWRPAEQFWRGYLAGLSQTTDFILERLPPDTPAEPAVRKSAVLSAEATDRLRAFAAGQGITLYTLLLGAWGLLLSRYSGRSGVVVGTTRACRHPQGIDTQAMVGLMINTLPFRVSVDTAETVSAYLQRVRRDWVSIRDHEHTPPERVWEWSGLPPGAPLFDHVLVFEHRSPGESLRNLGAAWEHRWLRRHQQTDSALTLAAYGGKQLSLNLIFRAGLFHSETVARMLGHLQTILERFAEAPHAPLGSLSILTAGEESTFEQWNCTAAPYPRERCVHELFEEQARRTPSKIALESLGGSLTYQELNTRANQLAAFLRRKGIGPEDIVAVCLPRSPETVLAILGVLKAGAAFLPLEPALPLKRLEEMLATARTKAVIARRGDLSTGYTIVHPENWPEALPHLPDGDRPPAAKPSNAAYAIFTSGSSGTPKATVVTHRSLVNHTAAAARIFALAASDRRLQFASMGSDVLVVEIFNYLSVGATLVFCPTETPLAVQDFHRILEQQRITITGIPSSWWNEWVSALNAGALQLPPDLRAVNVGMERVNPAAWMAWRKIAGDRVRLFNVYGPTEATGSSTVYRAGDSGWEGGSFVPIGKPIANAATYVLDPDGNRQPVGICGEFYIGGAGVARGYLGAPELTERSFPPDPFHPGAGNLLYRTGDLAFFLPDGNAVLLGRSDRQVKIRGFRVELDEVETALARHPAVVQCAVKLDESGASPKLVAFVSTRAGAEQSGSQLREHMARSLPEHMIPAGFVFLPELPKTPSGKIDWRALPAAGRAEWATVVARQPSTPAEVTMAELWKHVLGLSEIGAEDNFFALGGDSLRASHLIRLIQEEFGREIPLSTLLRAPILARLAGIVENAADASLSPHASALVHLQPQGDRLPFFCISSTPDDASGFRDLATYLGEGQPFFAIANPIRENQSLSDIPALARDAASLLRGFRPHGPYLLGGYCLGGILAVEVARQLTERGEQVPLVVLLDTPAPGYPRALRHVAPYWRSLLRRMSGPSSFPIARGGHFVPERIAVPVVQFDTFDEGILTRLVRVFLDARRGWNQVCAGEYRTHGVPGSHVTMLQAPHVEETARHLRTVLEQINESFRAGE